MKMVELEQVCDIRNGYAFKSEEYQDTGVPLLRISNFNDSDVFIDDNTVFIDPKYLSTKSDFTVEHGDILIALSGATTGKYGFYNFNFPSLLNQRIGVIKSGSSTQLSDRYFYHYLNVLKSEILRNAGGAAQPNISTKTIGKFQIPLPPLATQQKIAAILDAADAYRQKTKGLIEKYDQLAQSLFLEMFGDPITNIKNWEKVKFSEVGSIDRGKSKHRPRNAPELMGGKYPFIQTGDIANSNGYITEYTATYSEFGLQQSKIWKAGTLCITIAANIAKTGIMTFDACFPDSVVGFIPNTKTNVVFVQYWMSFLQKLLEDTAPESAQKNINLAILKELDFILPPLSLQTLFAERVALIETQKQQAQASLQKAEELFNSLLQRAFKGELA